MPNIADPKYEDTTKEPREKGKYDPLHQINVHKESQKKNPKNIQHMRSHVWKRVCTPFTLPCNAKVGPVELARVHVSLTRTWARTRSSRRGRCWAPAARGWTTPGRWPGPGRRRRSGLRWCRRPGSTRGRQRGEKTFTHFSNAHVWSLSFVKFWDWRSQNKKHSGNTCRWAESWMCVSYRDGLPACGLVVDLSMAEGGRLHACGGLRRLVKLQK